ncbi:unnamed protein product, partial [Mesorhabditis belari]|uniref:C-type lectin domain-containing protein n=1 Tax=Mesorhabditis belari TaxID=2138241 RepID=A0AAF3EPU5_9BILA
MKTRILFTFLVSFCSSCPHNWYEFPSDDVCVYIIKKSQNYTNAVTTCAQLNSTVVKITNIFENSYIGALLSGLNDQFPFIGVERKSNGTWVYQDASPLIYTNWAPGEPSLNSSLNCVYLGNSTLQWYATDCSTERPSFCSANEMPNHQCLDGWIYSNETDYCYYLENFSYPDNIHWQFYDQSEAEANCQKKDRDSHLVSIHSDAENKFIYDLVYSNVANLTHAVFDPCSHQWAFIGYSGFGFPGNGSWTDGSPVDFIDSQPTPILANYVISNDPSCRLHQWSAIGPDWAYPRYVCKMPSSRQNMK